MILLMPVADPWVAARCLKARLLRHQAERAYLWLRGDEGIVQVDEDPDFAEQWDGYDAALATYGFGMMMEIFLRKENVWQDDELKEGLRLEWVRARPFGKLFPWPVWKGQDAVHCRHREWLVWRNPEYRERFRSILGITIEQQEKEPRL